MQVFKFGGASVKDANGVKNLAAVLQKVGFENTLVIVSAMGKSTNALELVIKNYFENILYLDSAYFSDGTHLINPMEFTEYYNLNLLGITKTSQ